MENQINLIVVLVSTTKIVTIWNVRITSYKDTVGFKEVIFIRDKKEIEKKQINI